MAMTKHLLELLTTICIHPTNIATTLTRSGALVMLLPAMYYLPF